MEGERAIRNKLKEEEDERNRRNHEFMMQVRAQGWREVGSPTLYLCTHFFCNWFTPPSDTLLPNSDCGNSFRFKAFPPPDNPFNFCRFHGFI